MQDLQLKWVAVYSDGTNYPQYNEDGSENSYHAIDRERLSEFHLIRPDGSTHFAVALEKGQRLVFRRRYSMDGVTGETNWVLYLCGWQMTVGKKNIQSLNWLFPDQTIINTGKFNEQSSLFYSIVFHEEEKAGKIASS